WDVAWEAGHLLVEAYAAVGRLDDAKMALAALRRRMGRYLSPSLHAPAARAAALVSPRAVYEQAFAHALQLHEADGMPFERARTLLLLGERRRRGGAMRSAREALREAAEIFSALRAEAWLDRARRELG